VGHVASLADLTRHDGAGFDFVRAPGSFVAWLPGFFSFVLARHVNVEVLDDDVRSCRDLKESSDLIERNGAGLRCVQGQLVEGLRSARVVLHESRLVGRFRSLAGPAGRFGRLGRPSGPL
jgi:hypothetical protein